MSYKIIGLLCMIFLCSCSILNNNNTSSIVIIEYIKPDSLLLNYCSINSWSSQRDRRILTKTNITDLKDKRERQHLQIRSNFYGVKEGDTLFFTIWCGSIISDTNHYIFKNGDTVLLPLVIKKLVAEDIK